MKRTLLGASFAVMFLLIGFGSIALLTRLSEVDESPTASQATESSDLASESLASSVDELALTEEDCLPSEMWDPEEEVCYYECETDEECAEIEAQLDLELEALYDQFSGDHGTEEAPTDVDTTAYIVDGFTLTPTSSGAVDPEDKQVWDLFTLIAPEDFISENIVRYETYESSEDSTAAYVSPTEDNPSLWILGVNIDSTHPGGQFDRNETVFTLIHEFAHILTLEADQVPPDVSFDQNLAQSCATFYTGEGCSEPNSYINQFYNRFWDDIYNELPEENAPLAQFDQFYNRYQERFVTDYAATNPGEDIAESFTAYVLKPRPDANSQADEKVRFFYNYAELIKLRSQIRARLQ